MNLQSERAVLMHFVAACELFTTTTTKIKEKKHY